MSASTPARNYRICRCPSAVSAAVPVTIGNDFCLVRASDSAEKRAWVAPSKAFYAGVGRPFSQAVAKMSGVYTNWCVAARGTCQALAGFGARP
jgi:hypothetical protein